MESALATLIVGHFFSRAQWIPVAYLELVALFN